MRVLFVEPPKDIWFVMGEYKPPPYGIIQLAAFLERETPDIDIKVLDCNALKITWEKLEDHIRAYQPDIVASSSLSTCNTYEVARTLQAAKKVAPEALTVTGGQHFTATAQESMKEYHEIDTIVRGEGELTFTELVKCRMNGDKFESIPGITFRDQDTIKTNPDRPLIEDINDLPYPGYHFVKEHLHEYHFEAMSGRDAPYALIEGGRGCTHTCSFCTQWNHWGCKCRVKTPSRIADEFAYCYNEHGFRFIWLTDDNFGPGGRSVELADELIARNLGDDFMWFLQMRVDDVLTIKHHLPKMRKSGLRWVMMGVESPRHDNLDKWRKGINPNDAYEAISVLKENDIFTHGMFIIGEREDSRESIEETRRYVDRLDPDFAIFTALTPFPGTELYGLAREKGWIEDENLSHYDMAHAIMPTEHLTRLEVQEELWKCYRSFYGSWPRKIKGIFSSNEMKRRVMMHMAGQGILKQLRDLF
jgi:anaerobic magnesium-protoporphyrin IX monomethyl ester cyclase